ncbi:DUF3800 domain-containing protein [Tepidibacillus decaturensis]|uniref:DUF3800 domain-containing protein n=1 Tax=Tepidibacillus decaturensis TaxID=1413211 RepID=A0A135L1K9_9BACI|nr:DUF3800 domain-containing protein [Tepidibacillus decaturensis]KXG42888.1 hypothetical protein U473_01710 [Tepidibacillus decaturensis]
MLVFVDESGDTGFKFNQGSSDHFLVTMVFFERNSDAEQVAKEIESLRKEINWYKEFHFKELPDKVKEAFFTHITGKYFYRCIVIDKRIIYSDFLKENKKKFYNFVVGQMVKFSEGYLDNAKIIVDASSDKAFQNELKVYMRKKARYNGYIIKEIKFKNWRQNSLIQIADMYCGAIFKNYEKNYPYYYEKIKSKENNLWEFR